MMQRTWDDARLECRVGGTPLRARVRRAGFDVGACGRVMLRTGRTSPDVDCDGMSFPDLPR